MTIPERIGRYRIVGYLAAGGMAEILLGKITGPGGFERAVVIKRALPHLARQREFRDMFLDEARVVARIRHPNVVHVSELGEEGKDLFMVMEYLAGESVAGLLRRLFAGKERLPVEVALFVVAEALGGLHAAHELRDERGAPLGLVHRDVSPQNLFVTYDGHVKLLDFGIAKFQDRSVETSTGHLKGKFAYMSPEQCRGEVLDRRSDVFSAGIVLWELLTMDRLFQRPNELLCWKAIVEDETPRPEERLPEGQTLHAGVSAAVMRALAKDPTERPASAAEMRKELLALLRELDPEDRAPERLAAILERVFADRIAEKRELLRRVETGDEISSIPSAEVDVGEEIDITVAPIGEATEPSATPPASSPARWAMAGGAIALAAVAAGVLAFAFGGADETGATPPSVPAASVASPPQPASPEPASTSAPPEPSTPAHVTVELDTTPAGAEVRDEGGDVLGTTPCHIELASGDAERALHVVLSGYEEHVERIVPDMNQRLRISLTREARRRATPRRESGTEGQSAEEESAGGFFRFD